MFHNRAANPSLTGVHKLTRRNLIFFCDFFLMCVFGDGVALQFRALRSLVEAHLVELFFFLRPQLTC